MKDKKKASQTALEEMKIGESSSPKGEEIKKIYEENSTFTQPARESRISQVIILAIVFGLFAGIVGEIIFKTYLVNLGPFRDFNLSDSLLSGQGIVIKEPKKVVVEQDLQVGQVVDNLRQTSVNIYLKKTETDPLDKIYLPGEILGQGIIISGDGWIATAKEVVSDQKKSYAVITSEGKEYSPTNFISDAATGLVFMKIKADSLAVAKFGELEKLTLGQTVLTLNNSGRAVVTSLESLTYSDKKASVDFIFSSEEYRKRILIKDNLDRDYLGAPLVNLAGEVVGVITKSEAQGISTAVPMDYATGAIAGILKNKKISRSYFGVHYLDLANTSGLDEATTGGKKAGAVIWGTDALPAIEAASPAKKSGLKKGDIVIKIEDSDITDRQDLTELVKNHQPGEIIDVTIWRDKEEKVIKVELGGK
jgi:S1-C subfamily serine protease